MTFPEATSGWFERRASAPKLCSRGFEEFLLSRSAKEGCSIRGTGILTRHEGPGRGDVHTRPNGVCLQNPV